MAAKAKKPKVVVPKLSWKRDFQKNWPVYVLFLPAFIYTLVLSYTPLVGLLMAFENYTPARGLFASQWVGFQNFIDLFTGEEFLRALRNTVIIATIKCTIGFIPPVAFALVLSLVKNKTFKRITQTFSYMPNFIAAVVVVALVQNFLSDHGAITMLLAKFGLPVQNWLANPDIPVFWVIYILMGVWQGLGWGSIMYVSAIATVSGDLHEAAAIDGATRMQRLFKITLPCIQPMVVMMFVVGVGVNFIAGFDSILLMYMPSTYEVADTLYTYTYRMAFSAGASNYGLSTASGLFQSIVATVLLVGSNSISRKMGNSALF